MGTMAEHRLTLVAQYDDVMRNKYILTEGIEAEFQKFVWYQEASRKRWLEAEQGSGGIKERLKALESENNALQTKLKHARTQIEHEIKKRQKAEQDRDSLDRQVMLVRELLTDKNNRTLLNEKDREKLAFLSTDFHGFDGSPHRAMPTIEESASLLSPSDISYDKTEEDLDVDMSVLRSGMRWKRRSSDEGDDQHPENKRHRRSSKRRSRERRRHRRSNSAVVTTTTVTVQDGQMEAQAEITTDAGKKKKRHCSSPLKKAKSTSNVNNVDNAANQHTPANNSPGLRHYNSTGRSLSKPHYFVTKTVIKPETCLVCGKKIRFSKAAMKCRDCRSTSHPECKDQVPLPCVPTTSTPGTAKSQVGKIADYVPSEAPFIPALVIHCVKEVEDRGLSEEGIYRIPGSEREVKDLKEKFLKNRGTPNLANVDDIHVICGCLKDFLRNLKEPLITYTLWNSFVDAAECEDSEEGISATYQAISKLPLANRDTMAYIVLHLQRVSMSEVCRMTLGNIAKVFGPTLIGYSTPEPQPIQIMSETRKQCMVMEKLLRLSSDYWKNFIESAVFQYSVLDAPGTPITPEKSMAPTRGLMPVHTPVEETPVEKKSWFTPKFSQKPREMVKKPSQFFASPYFK